MSRMRGLAAKLRVLLQPRAVVGLALSGILLGFVINWANVGMVGAALRRFPPILLPVLFGLAVAREAIRVREWRYLLGQLRLHPSWRHTLLAVLLGDGSQILPAGIYIQNWLLQRTEEADVGVSLAATLGMQLLEGAVALAALCVIGVPGWGWLRPAALVVAGGYVAFLLLVSRPAVVRFIERHAVRAGLAGLLLRELENFLQGLDRLLVWPVIGRACLLTVVYLAFTISAFWVIVQAYGLASIGPLQALAIYAFVLAIIIINPLPSDLGISELSGTGILLAFGVPVAEGLTVMLIARFSLLLSVDVLALGATALLRRSIRSTINPGDSAEQPATLLNA